MKINEVNADIKLKDLIVFASQKKIDVNSFMIKYINDIIILNQPEIKTEEDFATLAEYVAEKVYVSEDLTTGILSIYLPANYLTTET
jgi:hypothetical protein